MEDNMALTEPMTHEDGSPVTEADIEASMLRMEMLEYNRAMDEFTVFSREFIQKAELRLAGNMRRIMSHHETDTYTWERWVNDQLYPEC